MVANAVRCGSRPGLACSAGVSTSTKPRSVKKPRMAAMTRPRVARCARLRSKRSGCHHGARSPVIDPPPFRAKVSTATREAAVMTQRSTRTIRLLLLAVAAGSLAAGDAWGWGATGHRFISRVAIESLPAEVPAFLRKPEVAQQMGELGREADRSK